MRARNPAILASRPDNSEIEKCGRICGGQIAINVRIAPPDEALTVDSSARPAVVHNDDVLAPRAKKDGVSRPSFEQQSVAQTHVMRSNEENALVVGRPPDEAEQPRGRRPIPHSGFRTAGTATAVEASMGALTPSVAKCQML
jgi:hypothetical protein